MTDTLQAPPQVRDTRMTKLAGWSQRHHWWAIGLWVVALVAITVGSLSVGSDYRNDNSLPGTESQELLETFEEHAPAQENDSLTIVIQAPDGIARTPEVAELVQAVVALDGVAAAQPPGAPGSISEDGTIGLAQVQLDHISGDNDPDDDARRDRHRPGVRGLRRAGRALGRRRPGGSGERGGRRVRGGRHAGRADHRLFLFGSRLAASLR